MRLKRKKLLLKKENYKYSDKLKKAKKVRNRHKTNARNNERKSKEKDNKIMMMDTFSMDSHTRAYYEHYRANIFPN